MSFLSPVWLLLGLLALPVLLLYMLKLRRREVEISSTYLWQVLLRDRQANAPWQRLKRNLLLFLQLLILTAMVLSLARPSLHVPAVATGSLVILLDASASMSATDVQPSRFEAARAIAQRLADGLENGSRMTLIQVGRQPVVLASAEKDRSILRQAIQRASPTQESANWQAALALAAGAASADSRLQNTTIVIISDGGLPQEGLPPLPVDVRYVPVGSSADNLAVSALALRPAGDKSELFASLENYGDSERSALLSIYRNDGLISAQELQVPAHGRASLTLDDLPTPVSTSRQPDIYMARLSTPEGEAKGESLDVLSLDDTAFAVNQPGASRRTLVISPGNLFLDRGLAALPGISAFHTVTRSGEGETPNQIQLPAEAFDLYVVDGILPTSPNLDIPQIPDTGSLLFVNPPPNPLFAVTGTFTPTLPIRVVDSPLTRFVDWSNIHVARAHTVQLPAWAQVLVGTPDRPLVFAGETGGRRIAVLTFDLHDSDLPLQVAFPILLANLVDYLLPSQSFDASQGLQPGDSLNIRLGPGISQVAIASPQGKIYTLTPTEEGFLFSQTSELGVYAVNFLQADGGQQAEYFAVNQFDPHESDIHPVAEVRLGRSDIPAAKQESIGERELWPWLAAAALSVLLLEWWAYHRRLSLPGKLRIGD